MSEVIMKRTIFADNAATTALDMNAYEAMEKYLLVEYGDASQPYYLSRTAKRALNEARATIAKCIGARTEEILFTSGGTESNNWAIKCFGAPAGFKIIYTSEIEHPAVLDACEFQRINGLCDVKYLYADTDGIISPGSLLNSMETIGANLMYSEDTAQLVSVMLVNHEIGTIEPVENLAEIAHQHNAYFHTDASLAVGHIPINVQEMNADMLSASAHKFNGPKGVGFLYVKKGTVLSPLLHGGSQEKRMRGGNENVAGIVGMAAAIKSNCNELINNLEHVRELENYLISQLYASGIPFFLLSGYDSRMPGILSISFPLKDASKIVERMDRMNIAISTGNVCYGKKKKISHVLEAIRLDEAMAAGTVRISLGKYNTIEDVDTIANAFRIILSED